MHRDESCSVFVLWLGLLLGQESGGAAPAQDTKIQVGKTVFSKLDGAGEALPASGLTKRFELTPASDGPLTVSLKSHDFDAFLRIEALDGSTLAEDDNGGVETNARIVLQARKGISYRIVAAVVPPGEGDFSLEVEAGEIPALSGVARIDTAISFRTVAADRALTRRDPWKAAWHFYRKGYFHFERLQFQDALDAYTESYRLYGEFDAPQLQADALTGMGASAISLSRFSEAKASLERARDMYLELGRREGELDTLMNLGLVHEALGDVALAGDCLRQALVIAQELKLAEKEARTRGKLALLEGSHDRSEETGELLKRLLEEARNGQNQASELRALLNLGLHYARSRELEGLRQARAYCELASELAVKLNDSAAELEARGNLGDVHLSLGDMIRARENHALVLELARKLRDRRSEATALGNLGVICQEMQDLRRALAFYEQHLELARSLQDREGELRALSNIGDCANLLGDHARAEDIWRQDLVQARASRDRVRELHLLRNLGDLAREQGRFAEARSNFDACELIRAEIQGPLGALEYSRGVLEKALGADEKAREYFGAALEALGEKSSPILQLSCLRHLAYIESRAEEHEAAAGHLEGALALARGRGRKPDECSLLLDLAGEWFNLGDYPRSRAAYVRASELARELNDRTSLTTALLDLGALASRQGDDAEAIRAFDEAMVLAAELQDEDLVAAIHGKRAYAHYFAGAFEQSRVECETSLAIARNLPAGACPSDIGLLSAANLRLGDRSRARSEAQDSLNQFHRLGMDGDYFTLLPLWTSARLAIADGDATLAQQLGSRAREVFELRSSRIRAGSEEPAALHGLLRQAWDETFQDLAWMAAQAAGQSERSKAIESGFRQAGRSKASNLLAGIVEHHRGARSREALKKRAELKAAREQQELASENHSLAIRAEKPAYEVDALQRKVRELQAETKVLVQVLREISPRDAALDVPDGLDPGQVRAAVIDSRTVLIEYAEGQSRLYAYVLGPATLELIDLGERSAIEECVARFLELVQTGAKPGSFPDVARVGRELFDFLLAPALGRVQHELRGIQIIPTARLAGLPFEALVIGASGEGEPRDFGDLEFVIDRYEVSYAPSSPVLADLAALGRSRTADTFLVLADPVYPSEPPEMPTELAAARPPLLGLGRSVPDPQSLQRLRNTREEALGIANLLVLLLDDAESAQELAKLRLARSGSLNSRNMDLYLGADANRSRLSGSLQQYSVLHLAAHGFVDRQFPQNTGLALSAGPGPKDPIFFTIQDVLGLDLEADLVVLSACDTARGVVQEGEGVESLARAFMYSGARSVIASLWQVEDRAAAETMRVFYSRSLSQQKAYPSPSQALRDAKLSVRHGLEESRGVAIDAGGGVPGAPGTGHPFYWAPFIYIGLSH